MKTILTLLPKGEGFSPKQFGAIALCVKDFTLHSQYRDQILVVGGDASLGFDGVDYHAVPPARWYENRTRGFARRCVALAKNHQARLLEIHNRPHLVHLMAQRVSAAITLHLHNDPQEMRGAKTAKERETLLARCALILCVSEYIRSRFLQGLPHADASRVVVVHNGITLSQPAMTKEKRILYVGRMTEGKGALILAQALRLVLPRLEGWKAVFVGSRRHEVASSLSAYEQQTFAVLSDLAQQVEIAGFLSHEATIAEFLRAEIAVIPSVWQEPFGRTAIEAMAAGCAVISSGRGGLLEVTGDAACTLKDVSPECLALALEDIAVQADRRRILQQRGRKRAEDFSIEAKTKALDKLRQPFVS